MNGSRNGSRASYRSLSSFCIRDKTALGRPILERRYIEHKIALANIKPHIDTGSGYSLVNKRANKHRPPITKRVGPESYALEEHRRNYDKMKAFMSTVEPAIDNSEGYTKPDTVPRPIPEESEEHECNIRHLRQKIINPYPTSTAYSQMPVFFRRSKAIFNGDRIPLNLNTFKENKPRRKHKEKETLVVGYEDTDFDYPLDYSPYPVDSADVDENTYPDREMYNYESQKSFSEKPRKKVYLCETLGRLQKDSVIRLTHAPIGYLPDAPFNLERDDIKYCVSRRNGRCSSGVTTKKTKRPVREVSVTSRCMSGLYPDDPIRAGILYSKGAVYQEAEPAMGDRLGTSSQDPDAPLMRTTASSRSQSRHVEMNAECE